MSLPEGKDPIDLFNEWFEEAKRSTVEDATAMSLATVDATGAPSNRMVLLKAVDQRGFVFYTNLESRKGHDLKENPRAALCFYWMPLEKQVRIEGRVEPVTPEEADRYFDSRPRESRIGAWASKQSTELEDRFALEKRVAFYMARYPLGKVPRPPHWSGYRVVPEKIEFWLKKPFRLHERLLFERSKEGWTTRRLYP